MVHNYQVKGATCQSCIEKIQKALSQIEGVRVISGTLVPPQVTLEMGKHQELDVLNQAIRTAGNYSLETIDHISPQHSTHGEMLMKEKKYSLKDYLPLIVIFAYIFFGSFLLLWISGKADWLWWMMFFEGLFFILFSLFKVIDLKGFAEGYSSYDVLAQKWLGWGFLYPFIELGLGIAYLTGFQPKITTLFTIFLTLFGSIGLSKSLLRKSKIQCACLGTMLKVPLTTISLLENLFMAAMAFIMFLKF